MLSWDVQSEKSESEDAEVLDTVTSGRYSYCTCPTFYLTNILYPN